ncbi:MAG: 5'-nucleotidase C-terminal domain-containing protein [Crocinitomicaceae bacterium]
MKALFYLFCFLLAACASPKIADYESKGIQIDSTTGTAGLDSMISPYRQAMEAEMKEVIGTATVSLEKKAPESPLSNFAADAVYEAGLKYGNKTKDIGPDAMKKSFCLLNFGGLRAPINKGEITVGEIFEFMPFDNTLVLVKLSGDKVKELVDYLYLHSPQPVSNAEFKLSETLREVKIGGKDYTYDAEVVVITSNYLAEGGDKMDFFKDPVRKWDSGILLRDIFIDYIRSAGTLGEYKPDGRIILNAQ